MTQPLAVHRTILVVDVEGFGDIRRTNANQLAVRTGLYGALELAFGRAGISWEECDREDRGDGVFILVPPQVAKGLLVESLPGMLAEALRVHNEAHMAPERFRLRMALHAGEVSYDSHGVTAASVNLAFRLLEAPGLKAALAGSPGVLALIVSSWFFDEVVRHSPRCNPAAYIPVNVGVKETAAAAWLCLPDLQFPQGGVVAGVTPGSRLAAGPGDLPGRMAYELDPAAADPDGRASTARQRINGRQEAERAGAYEEDTVLAARDRLAVPVPGAVGSTEERLAGTAVDHCGQASAGRLQTGHHKEAGEQAPLVRVDKTPPGRSGNSKTRRHPARLYSGIVGAIALAGLLAMSLLLATHSPKTGTGTSARSSSSSAGGGLPASGSSSSILALSGTLNGGGSILQTVFQQAAISGITSTSPHLAVNYSGGGSDQGREDLASGVANFAASDSPIPHKEQADFRGKTVLYFPVMISPITICYYLSGPSRPLQLSAPVLADIFEDKVTNWNNPAILAQNPGVSLPGTKITTTVRSDSSDTTRNFAEFLVKAAGSAWTLGRSSVIGWPSATHKATGNRGVAQTIKSIPGAIGYLDYADAKAAGLTCASIKNSAGDYIAASPTSASAAASQVTVASNLTFSAIWAPGASSYPITYQSWDLVDESQPNTQTAKNLHGYIGYLLGPGQHLLPQLGYAQLPPTIDQMAKAQLSKIGT